MAHHVAGGKLACIHSVVVNGELRRKVRKHMRVFIRCQSFNSFYRDTVLPCCIITLHLLLSINLLLAQHVAWRFSQRKTCCHFIREQDLQFSVHQLWNTGKINGSNVHWIWINKKRKILRVYVYSNSTGAFA